MPKFIIEKVANMVFIASDCGVIFYAWNIEDYTERKRNNAIAKLKTQYNNNVCFVFNF